MLHHKHSKNHAVGIAHRVRNRIALAAVSLCAAFGFVLVGTTASFAHDNTIIGNAVCTAPGNWAITWTISNDWSASETATVTGVSPGTISDVVPVSVPIAATAVNNTQPFASNTVVETLPGTTTGGISITTSSTWNAPSPYGPVIDTGNATLVGTCKATTTANLTPGFWKTHDAATTALLPQKLGDYLGGYNVTSFVDAQVILSGMGCGKGSDGPLNCMAGMLLAAELNLAQGGSACIVTDGVIGQANTLLTKYHYAGYGTYTLSSADQTLAMTLHDELSAYNIDGIPTC